MKESKLQKLDHVEFEDLEEFCETYLDNSGPVRTRPYINKSDDAEFGQMPNEHKIALNALSLHIKREAASMQRPKLTKTKGDVPRSSKNLLTKSNPTT